MKNVDLEDVENDGNLLNEMYSLNDLNDNFTLNEMNIVAKFKFHNNFSIILEISLLLRTSLLTKGFMYNNCNKCYFSDHLRVMKCKNCTTKKNL